MKKNILHFIKITLALVLFLQVGKVSAQTISFSGGGGPYPFDPVSMATACGITKPAPGTGTLNTGTVLIAAASVPVTSMSFLVASIGGGGGSETHFFDAVGIANETVSVPAACAGLITVSAPGDSRGISVGNTLATDVIVTKVTVSSVTPFTEVKMIAGGIGATIITSSAEAFSCGAGSTAPSLSAFTVANVCPATTANLNSLLSSSATAAQVSMLKWFTDAAHTTAVADPTKAPAGTYYAFYYDSTNNCYSPASAAVTATTSTVCSLIIENTCPTASVDLAARVTSTASLGYTYTYHSGTPATTSNKISNIVTTSGTYYVASYFAAQDCYTNTSRPMVVTIRDCCSSVVPPTFN